MKYPPSPLGLFGKLANWYDEYAGSFSSGDARVEDAVRLKSEHTKRVVTEMAALCSSIDLDTRRCTMAAIAALLHDVARFEQFRRFRTFSDRLSMDHAAMAIDLINERRLLEELEESDASAIAEAVRNHNAAVIPSGLSNNGLLLCRLLRDADKLDIFRIVLDYYIHPDPDRHDTIQVGVPDGVTVSTEVMERVARREIVPYEFIKTVTDFKMIQLGWIYDLNFEWSLKCVAERGIIEALRLQLPGTPEVASVVEAVRRYAEASIARL